MPPPTDPTPPDIVGIVDGMLIGRLDDVRESVLLLTIRDDDGRVVQAALPRSAAGRIVPEDVGKRVSVMMVMGVATQVMVEVWP